MTTFIRPLQDFLRTEAAAGVLLLVMVPIALLWANGPFSGSYEEFWHTSASLGFGSASFSLDMRHWVNDALMALFFYVVGLEIKRELVDGQLQHKRKAMTPALAALGGMVVPALVYVAVNAGSGTLGGWGIPMATDIAIVLGFLALAGDRVPPGLKTFLLTLAIVDDIGAIVVIAVFYTGDALDFTALGVACLLFALVYGARRVGLRHPVIYAVLALGAWAATYASGVHATIAGVVLALLTSAKPLRDSRYVDAEALADVSTVEAASETAALARQSVSSVEWLQHLLHPWSSYVVLPLFALANAGIVISADSLRNAVESPVAVGVALGLVFGKPLGVCAMTYFGIRILGTELPSGVHMTHVVLGSLLTGVGFTVALFISDLAFVQAEFAEEAKAGVLVASLVAGILGYTALRFGLRKHQIARS